MTRQEKNVGNIERIACNLGGLALVATGIRQRSVVGALISAGGAALVYRGVSGYCPMYSRLGIDRTKSLAGSVEVEVERVVTIMRPAEEIYSFFRKLENLPSVFKHVTTITEETNTRSHWEVKEAGIHLKWDAEIVEDESPRRIAWRSLPGGDIETQGEVEFTEAPGQRGTEMRVHMTFSPPGGAAASVLAPYLRRITRIQLGQELRRLKQLLETGEIATGARLRADTENDSVRGRESGIGQQQGIGQGRESGIGQMGGLGIGQQGTIDETQASGRRVIPTQEDVGSEIPGPTSTTGMTGMGGNAAGVASESMGIGGQDTRTNRGERGL